MTALTSTSPVKWVIGNDGLISPLRRRTLTRLLTVLLTAMMLIMPGTATAQEQLGSVTVKKLPTSLNTPGAHPVVFELSGGELTAPITLTGDSDTVHFSDLAPGTYTIRELATRSGDVARATIAPLTVTIPTDGVYDVTVYPKPQPLVLLKSSDVSRITPGSEFRYILEGTVPLPDTNGQLHRYIIRDALPESLTLNGEHSVQLQVGDRVVPLLAEEHYVLSNRDGRVITVELTPAGLELLARERGNSTDVVVHVSFGVQASTDLTPGSFVLNIAHLYPDGYPETGEDAVTSNEHALPVDGSGGLIIPGIPLPDSGGSSPDSSITPGSVTPGSAERPTRSGGLASTGASVFGLIGVGVLLTIIGITVIMRGRRGE